MGIPLTSDENQASTAHREMMIFQGSNNLVFLHMYIVYSFILGRSTFYKLLSEEDNCICPNCQLYCLNCMLIFSIFLKLCCNCFYFRFTLCLCPLSMVFGQIENCIWPNIANCIVSMFLKCSNCFCLTVSLCLCPYSSPLTWNISQLVKQKHAFSRLFTGIYISPERHAKPIQKLPSIWHLSGGPKASFSDICKNIQNKIKHLAFPHVGLVEPGTGCPKQVSLLRHIYK